MYRYGNLPIFELDHFIHSRTKAIKLYNEMFRKIVRKVFTFAFEMHFLVTRIMFFSGPSTAGQLKRNITLNYFMTFLTVTVLRKP